MTAPMKHSEVATVVEVALGDRAYDIVIGRDVLQSLGARVSALRPGARTAIVTDRQVAKHWLEDAEASLSRPESRPRASLWKRARARKPMPDLSGSAKP